MTINAQIATNVFVALALVANLFALAIVIPAIAAALRVPAAFNAVALTMQRYARPLAIAIATTCTAGSLYYSEVVGFAPCRLCWYQRFVMYPLALVMLLGYLRLWRSTRIAAAALAVLGSGISLYHWLVERVPALARGAACSLQTPCSVPWFTRLGFVTIAWMAFSGFVAIAALMLCEARYERLVPTERSEDATMPLNDRDVE
jgi:disulfide bond formation protein DsbB